jgi:hypothetical protein
MTYKELQESIKSKNYFIVDEYNNGFLHEFGFKKKENSNVVHWFCVLTESLVLFSHSVSLNTGKQNSGIKHGLDILHKLQK